MYCKRLLFSLSGFLMIFSAFAQSEGTVTVLKSGMNAIVANNSQIVKIADGFQFTEGPLWHPDGYLLFSDIPASKIMKYVPGQGVSVHLENSGFVGSEDENNGQGSNGLTFDNSGNLIICQHGARQVLKADRAGNFLPMARQYGGKRLNSPNDVVVKSDGSVFFTDPPWGLAKGLSDPAKELQFQGVYRLKNGNLSLLDSTLKMPNGIAFSSDEKYLYVTDTEGNRKLYYRYEFDKNGELLRKSLFFDASEIKGDGGPDGIKVDTKGNCYFTGPGGVLVVNEKGEHLGTISPKEIPANIGFGGKDGKTLYMTCRTGLYAIELKVEGILPWKN